jgi:hypothetical protein
MSQVGNCVTSLSCWGRVVIGSLTDYQSVGAGSNPVASTTVLTASVRSIGNGQKSCSRFAWEGLERSGPFPISPAYRATLLFKCELSLIFRSLTNLDLFNSMRNLYYFL